MIRAGDSIENPVTGERLVFRQTSTETGGEAVVDRDVRPAERLRRGRARPPDAGGALRGPPRQRRLQGRRREARRRPRHRADGAGRGRRTGSGTRVTRRRALRLRDPARAAVRVADRDDVRARRRRQDQSQGHAEPAPARGDRARPTSTPCGCRSRRRSCSGSGSRSVRRSAGLLGYGPVYVPADAEAVAGGLGMSCGVASSSLALVALVLALAALGVCSAPGAGASSSHDPLNERTRYMLTRFERISTLVTGVLARRALDRRHRRRPGPDRQAPQQRERRAGARLAACEQEPRDRRRLALHDRMPRVHLVRRACFAAASPPPRPRATRSARSRIAGAVAAAIFGIGTQATSGARDQRVGRQRADRRHVPPPRRPVLRRRGAVADRPAGGGRGARVPDGGGAALVGRLQRH